MIWICLNSHLTVGFIENWKNSAHETRTVTKKMHQKWISKWPEDQKLEFKKSFLEFIPKKSKKTKNIYLSMFIAFLRKQNH